jgi:putative ABC transport system ATP-binding protein
MEENQLIVMNNITKVYKMGKVNLQVLYDVSFTIKKGEFVAILGPSGSGKSTIMNILGCIDVATSGEYILDGKNINARSEDELSNIRNKKIGFIFQKFNLLSRYSAVHNVELPLILRGEKRKHAHEKAIKMLNMVGLGERIHHKPTELSGGQQQRVAIARALIGDPELLLADEPTGNLDSKSGRDILDFFIKLNDAGNTIVLITHDLKVAQMAKRIIHVNDGSVS